MTKVFSWNLNGIRAAARSGFFDWLRTCQGDVVMLQEVRAELSQMQPDWPTMWDYWSVWAPARRKGYSGVGIYSRKPLAESDLIRGLGIEEFDAEGRTLGVVQGNIAYLSCYFPNSQPSGARLAYKLAYCQALLKRIKELERDGLRVVVGGDFNIAHEPIDLENPSLNEKNPGYLPEERAWLSRFLQEGYLDTFRLFEKGGGFYTWWSNRPGIRERNLGWRIDYHCVSESLKDKVRAATIHADVMGSDHCPVGLVLETDA